MRAIGTALLLTMLGAGTANAIGCVPGYVSIGCPPAVGSVVAPPPTRSETPAVAMTGGVDCRDPRFAVRCGGTELGPGFDCSKATQPLARLICADRELSKNDLHFNQAYYALRQQLDPAGQQRLQQEDPEFLDSVLRLCDIRESGPVAGSPDCVGAQYDRKRAEWLARLTDPAREEAARPIEQHVALQADLQRIGFLPPTAKVDGVYRAATRSAILAWQVASNRPATGPLSDADAATLATSSGATLPPAVSSSPAPPPREDYGQYVPPRPPDEVRPAAPAAPAAFAPSVSGGAAGGALLPVLAILLGCYFLPAIVAASRHHHNAVAIFLLNLLLGWTFLGWVAALVWSATAVRRPGA